MSIELHKLLTQKEVATLLVCSESFLEQARCRKPEMIPFIKIGKSVRYSREALQRFIDSNTIGAGI